MSENTKKISLSFIMNSSKNILVHPRAMVSGFFSHCSVYLHQIIQHIKSGHQLENIELGEFEFYKKNKHEKVYDSFFKTPSGIANIINKKKLNFPLYSNKIFYKESDFLGEKEIIKEWFTPKKEIQLIKNNFIIDLSIKPKKSLSLYYRGTDTQADRPGTRYDIFIKKAESIISKNNIDTILLQTDDKMFEDYVLSYGIKNKIVKIKELPSIYSHQGYHFKIKKNKIDHARQMLASVLLMSECRFVLCNTSNVSRWILLYRKYQSGYYQFLKNKCL